MRADYRNIPYESEDRRRVMAGVAGTCLLFLSAAQAVTPLRAPAVKDGNAQIEAAVRRAFGPGVEMMWEFRPYSLTGDFNGDRFSDLAVMVRVRAPSGRLAKGVTILNPWDIRRTAAGGSSGLALAIIHGGRKGWSGAPLRRYLLTDRDFFATPIWQSSAPKDLIGLVRKPRATQQGRRLLPRPAKGDAIRVATEAGINTLLYWDGKTYRLYAPPEEP